jgi:hypothetical protein
MKEGIHTKSRGWGWGRCGGWGCVMYTFMIMYRLVTGKKSSLESFIFNEAWTNCPLVKDSSYLVLFKGEIKNFKNAKLGQCHIRRHPF